jgi:SAM-dependent methyltransferase
LSASIRACYRGAKNGSSSTGAPGEQQDHANNMVAEVIDRALLRRRLRRAHAGGKAGAAFLLEPVVADLAERLAGVERRFPVAVAHSGQSDRLADALSGSGKTDAVYRLETTEAALSGSRFPGAVGDEEALPLKPGSIDLFASTLALQWCNDLPGALIQIRQALRPDGLFLAALTGGSTLAELREALFAAETEIRGGASPRVLPTADTRDLGALLQRAGFALPVADRDALTVRYDTLFDLLRDLKAMGATSVLAERERRPAGRRLFLRAAEIYAERFSDPDGRIRASFEIISLSGWSPHESQQEPARRGSGQVSLAKVLGRDVRGR